MSGIPYGVFHEQFGRTGRAGGFINDAMGLPRLFTKGEAEAYAARCRRELGSVGQHWTARPMPAHVLDHVRRNVDRLPTHGFGREPGAEHLPGDYHEVLCWLGARLKGLALDRPEALRQFIR